jgi:uncharacterized protein (UPF0276 family)
MRGLSAWTRLWLGIGWRPEIALMIERRTDLGFVEVMAEDLASRRSIPAPIDLLRERGVTAIVHGVSLNLGGAARLDRERLNALVGVARAVKAPLVSEHVAFVRSGGREAGHLMPVPRTREALEVIVEHVREAQAALPVPLALENIAAVFEWPGGEMDEATFLSEILDRTGAFLLLDIENVYANARNHGFAPKALLEGLPLERIGYVHVGGGIEHDGIYHDTHAHSVPDGVLRLLEDLCARTDLPGVMLERDDHFPSDEAMNAELDAIKQSFQAGQRRARESR